MPQAPPLVLYSTTERAPDAKRLSAKAKREFWDFRVVEERPQSKYDLAACQFRRAFTLSRNEARFSMVVSSATRTG